MGKKERIANALSKVMSTLEVPAFKGYPSADFLDIPLSELDSLGMVNLIIGMEDALKQEFGKDIPLLGRSDVFNTQSLSTTGMFIDYIDQIL